ncbi:hypothetical protein DFJ63DRAFT_139501 [Scheffersomyces coipomensis]|uniref:uncharacterized protein n=1 Tax=Scheffersomyces coipomensis TaxID=1788519 RepID=UPI00315D6662
MFELRLLNFFNNYCIYGFSHNPDDDIHFIWRNLVPPMFIQSELIRNSICAFSCLNLFPFCDDLDSVRIEDDSNSVLKFSERFGSPSSTSENHLSTQSGEVFIKTTNYFTNTVSGKNQLIQSMQNANGNDKSKLATEFMISTIMIFTFLATHHHKLVPLVSFDKSESDFISICQGIRNTITEFASIVRHSVFKDVFTFEVNLEIPTVDESDIPVIVQLRQDLELEYGDENLLSSSIDDYTTFRQVLEILQISIFKSVSYGYSVPLYRWILLLSKHYVELVYDKCPFALRLLYVFSSLATLSRLQLLKHSNLWVDYMKWYKQHNFDLYGGWRYSMDESLFCLVFDKDFSLLENNESSWKSFDPEFLAQVI